MTDRKSFKPMNLDGCGCGYEDVSIIWVIVFYIKIIALFFKPNLTLFQQQKFTASEVSVVKRMKFKSILIEILALNLEVHQAWKSIGHKETKFFEDRTTLEGGRVIDVCDWDASLLNLWKLEFENASKNSEVEMSWLN